MEPVAFQSRAMGFLGRMIGTGNLPGGLIFSGVPGLGKRRAARYLAMALNCGAPGEGDPALSALFEGVGPCGGCASCRKVGAGNHPDVLTLKKDGAFVKIAQVRGLLETLSMRPAEGRVRVVVIEDAADMNREASNALLKALEEPPPGTLFLLLAEESASLLPTIVSRCQEIRFVPVAPEILARALAEGEGLDPDEAVLYARMAQGSPETALSLARKNAGARRQWLDRTLETALAGSVADRLLLAEFLAKDKEALKQDLMWMRQGLRDRAVDRAAGKGVAGLLSRIEAAFACETDLKRNVNPRLAVEAMLLLKDEDHG